MLGVFFFRVCCCCLGFAIVGFCWGGGFGFFVVVAWNFCGGCLDFSLWFGCCGLCLGFWAVLCVCVLGFFCLLDCLFFLKA